MPVPNAGGWARPGSQRRCLRTNTGAQSKAARALVEWPRDHVAGLSGLTVDALRKFEIGRIHPGEAAVNRLRAALENEWGPVADDDV